MIQDCCRRERAGDSLDEIAILILIIMKIKIVSTAGTNYLRVINLQSTFLLLP